MADSGSDSETEICEVQKILERRAVDGGKYEYLIRWKGFDSSEDSWEPEEHLLDCTEVLHDFLMSLNNAKIVHLKTPPPTQNSANGNTRSTRQRKTQTQTPIVSKVSPTAKKSRSTTKQVTSVTTSTYKTTKTESSSSSSSSVLSDAITVTSAIRSRTSSLFSSSTANSPTPYIRPVSELKRPPIKHHRYSTGKVTNSAKAVRRTLEMNPRESFLLRHQWWICYLFILFIVSSVAIALAWRLYTHKPQQQNM